MTYIATFYSHYGAIQFRKTVKNETRRSDHACSEKLEFFLWYLRAL